MEYNELMLKFGESFGLESFTPDDQGVYRLSVDDTIVSFYEIPQKGLVGTVASICEVPCEGREQIYKILLSAMAPGGAAEEYDFFIGDEEDGQCIYLRRTDVLAELDLESFRHALEEFANVMEDWRTSIQDYREALPAINAGLEERVDESRKLGMNLDGFMSV